MGWVVHRVWVVVTTDVARRVWWLGWVMGWRLTVNRLGDGTSSHEYLWPAEAWEAYDAAIIALEADGFAQARGGERLLWRVCHAATRSGLIRGDCEAQ